MACASTDGLGIVARAASPPPHCTLVILLALLLCSINAIARSNDSGGIDCPSCGGAAGVCRPPQQWTYYSPHPFLPDNGIECQ